MSLINSRNFVSFSGTVSGQEEQKVEEEASEVFKVVSKVCSVPSIDTYVSSCSCCFSPSDNLEMKSSRDLAEKKAEEEEILRVDTEPEIMSCICHPCICGEASERSGKTEMGYLDFKRFEADGEEEQGVVFEAGYEELRLTREEWVSESKKITDLYLKTHRIDELFQYLISFLLAKNPGWTQSMSWVV